MNLDNLYSGQGMKVFRLPKLKKGDSLMIGDMVIVFETTKDKMLQNIAQLLRKGGHRINAIGTNHIEYE